MNVYPKAAITACAMALCFSLTYPSAARAAAGTNREPVPDTCSDKAKKAWDDYRRDERVFSELYKNAMDDGDRALEDFVEQGNEILQEQGVGVGFKLSEEIVPKIAEHVVEKTGAAESALGTALMRDLAPEIEGASSATGNALVLVEEAAALKTLSTALDNLDYAQRSEDKFIARADDKWEKALDDLKRALAAEQECADLKKKAEAEDRLEKQARRYIEVDGAIGPDGTVKEIYYVGNKEYKDATQALDAAKQLLSRRSGQSGALSLQPLMTFVALQSTPAPSGQPTEAHSVARADIKEAMRQLKNADRQIKTGTLFVVRDLKKSAQLRRNLDSIRSRMGG
jgi:tetratricopeptide (TPR) repeat protein